MFKKKNKQTRNWLIKIESPVDGTGNTFYDVYENSSRRVLITSIKELRRLIDKYNPKMYAVDTITARKLDIFKVKYELTEFDHSF